MFVMNKYEKFTVNPDLAKVMFSEAIFINDKDLSERMKKIIHRHKKELEVLIEQAKKRNEITDLADTRSIFRMVIGSMRFLVIQWCFNSNSFDLKKEGSSLWNNIENIIKKR